MCDRVGLHCHLNVILAQKLRDCQITERGEYCRKGERFWKKMWEGQKQSLWFLFRLYLFLCGCWCVSVFSERWHSSIRRRLQWVCCTSSDRINGYRAVAKSQVAHATTNVVTINLDLLFSLAATKQLQMHQPNFAFPFSPHSMRIVMRLASVHIVILVRWYFSKVSGIVWPS